MNTQLARLITKLISHIFSDSLVIQHKLLEDIQVQQFRLTNSPNFIYKGKSYIYEQYKNSVNPLDKSLISNMKLYLSYSNELDKDMQQVHSYLVLNKPKTNADIYYLLPECLNSKLQDAIHNKGIVSYQSKPKGYEDICSLIQQRELEKLL